MKKSYVSPEMEIEKFKFPNSAITTSNPPTNPGITDEDMGDLDGGNNLRTF